LHLEAICLMATSNFSAIGLPAASRRAYQLYFQQDSARPPWDLEEVFGSAIATDLMPFSAATGDVARFCFQSLI
jgi:hypothetical protein